MKKFYIWKIERKILRWRNRKIIRGRWSMIWKLIAIQSRAYFFIRFQWSLNMHAKKRDENWKVSNRRASTRSASCTFNNFLFNNRFIYWKSNWFTFEHFHLKGKSWVGGIRLRVEQGGVWVWVRFETFLCSANIFKYSQNLMKLKFKFFIPCFSVNKPWVRKQ